MIHTEEEADVVFIHAINANNEISMNYCDYAPLHCQRTMKMYPQDQNMIQQNEEFVVRKTLFWIYY